MAAKELSRVAPQAADFIFETLLLDSGYCSSIPRKHAAYPCLIAHPQSGVLPQIVIRGNARVPLDCLMYRTDWVYLSPLALPRAFVSLIQVDPLRWTVDSLVEGGSRVGGARVAGRRP